VDAFSQTRTRELESKIKGMKQLAREVNACAEGIKYAVADAEIDVWDA
jgi:D-amino peptidase